ncbi:uncharacterized protein LTR77_002246 [Saxophila tyrrhenica]|uniref:Uncharacterized protein n=1 Tax=Saxophila tyrrhenica TaxID=1690608 RepID=A0AAV9PLI1_9PEZI|nr:hypothetical protein LTR77_002246 [Saxophila tyrrhenica]
MPALRLKLSRTLFLRTSPRTSPPISPASPRSTAFEPLPLPVVKVVLDAFDAHDWSHSSDALTDWLNARWAKSGYVVSREVVCWTLRSEGRDARMGLGDGLEGDFVREVSW